jgi:hypothetical protein
VLLEIDRFFASIALVEGAGTACSIRSQDSKSTKSSIAVRKW